MGAQQSKEELVYEQVKLGNVEGIRALHRDGAGLEWMDQEGRTPLILACLINPPDGVQVVQTLLQLGANVNAYRPGTHQGTPLHHAAKRGLLQTVHLLLSHHATNPFRLNDDCHTPLDLARAKGHCNVVRAIENHICIFSGWLRELHGPSFLEALASQWLSTKIWAVVLPCDYRNPTNPVKFELAIYTDSKVAQPRTTIALWKVRIEDLNINQPNPMVVIIDKSNRTKHKFLSAHEGDKQQLLWFYNACRGIVQGAPAVPIPQGHHPVATASAPPASAPPSAAEDTELEMIINASIQSAMTEGLSPFPDPSQSVLQSTNSGNPMHSSSSAASASGSAKTQGSCATQIDEDQSDLATSIPAAQEAIPPVASAASAPPVTEAILSNNDDDVRYPVIDTSPVVGVQIPATEGSKIGASKDDGGASDDSSGSCVICLDAPVEGACVPCGHMAGCMSCLNEVKAKGWGCPVCRTKIDQVIKLFSV